MPEFADKKDRFGDRFQFVFQLFVHFDGDDMQKEDLIAAAAGTSFLVTCKAKPSPPAVDGIIDILEDGLSLATRGIVDDEGVLLGFSPPPPRSRSPASPRGLQMAQSSPMYLCCAT